MMSIALKLSVLTVNLSRTHSMGLKIVLGELVRTIFPSTQILQYPIYAVISQTFILHTDLLTLRCSACIRLRLAATTPQGVI
jgi:hypothetical protein